MQLTFKLSYLASLGFQPNFYCVLSSEFQTLKHFHASPLARPIADSTSTIMFSGCSLSPFRLMVRPSFPTSCSPLVCQPIIVAFVGSSLCLSHRGKTHKFCYVKSFCLNCLTGAWLTKRLALWPHWLQSDSLSRQLQWTIYPWYYYDTSNTQAQIEMANWNGWKTNKKVKCEGTHSFWWTHSNNLSIKNLQN